MASSKSRPPAQPGERAVYDALDQLDRLEELLEEMRDLGGRSVDDVERRIGELHALVGDQEPEDG